MKIVVYSTAARGALSKLPPPIRENVTAKVHRYAQSGAGDVKRLTATTMRRLRVGDYRIIFEENDTTIFIARVGHRSSIY